MGGLRGADSISLRQRDVSRNGYPQAISQFLETKCRACRRSVCIQPSAFPYGIATQCETIAQFEFSLPRDKRSRRSAECLHLAVYISLRQRNAKTNDRAVRFWTSSRQTIAPIGGTLLLARFRFLAIARRKAKRLRLRVLRYLVDNR